MCKRWKLCVESLLNVSEQKNAEITASSRMIARVFEEAMKNIRRDEVENQGKTAGSNGVGTEYPRSGGSYCDEGLVRMFNMCLNA